MTALTPDEASLYTIAAAIQAGSLTALKPGGAFAWAAYLVAAPALLLGALGVYRKNWDQASWLVWFLFAAGMFFQAQDGASALYDQAAKLADALTMGIARAVDTYGFFDPITKQADPAAAFPARTLAVTSITARLDYDTDTKVKNLLAASPRPCLTREVVDALKQGKTFTQAAGLRMIEVGGTGYFCDTYLTSVVDPAVKAWALGKPAYGARAAIRRALLEGAASIPALQATWTPNPRERTDEAVWNALYRFRLWLTDLTTLGRIQGYATGVTMIAVPYVVVAAFFRDGWWNLIKFFGFLLAARFTGVLFYLIHAFVDRPAANGITVTDIDVTVLHTLQSRVVVPHAEDEAIMQMLDHALWFDAAAVLAAPVLSFYLVFKVLLPYARSRIPL